MAQFKSGHWYKFNDRGETHIGQYMGRQREFECCVCGKGSNAFTFNLWHNKVQDYETWGYGEKHLPEIIEDYGMSDEVMLDE